MINNFDDLISVSKLFSNFCDVVTFLVSYWILILSPNITNEVYPLVYSKLYLFEFCQLISVLLKGILRIQTFIFILSILALTWWCFGLSWYSSSRASFAVNIFLNVVFSSNSWEHSLDKVENATFTFLLTIKSFPVQRINYTVRMSYSNISRPTIWAKISLIQSHILKFELSSWSSLLMFNLILKKLILWTSWSYMILNLIVASLNATLFCILTYDVFLILCSMVVAYRSLLHSTVITLLIHCHALTSWIKKKFELCSLWFFICNSFHELFCFGLLT